MANNIDFISSIEKFSDFEELIRRVAKYIWNSEAYIINGPYDGGRDLVYMVKGREVKSAIQITIQKANFEAKILEDAKKILKLVEDFNYPSKLTVFYSQTLTNSKELQIKRQIREETGIELEVYDANKIDQIITYDQPEILSYLLEHIHNYKQGTAPQEDVKARTFYEYLAMSKDSAQLKTSVIDAKILSSLVDNELKKQDLLSELIALNINSGSADGRINYLIKNGKVSSTEDVLSLSESEKLRLKNIIAKDQGLQNELIENLGKFCVKEIGTDISKECFKIIRNVYSNSVDVQISEYMMEPPKLSATRQLVQDLELLIERNKQKKTLNSRDTAKRLIEIASKNQYLSNFASSLICINLFNQKKLLNYIEEKKFFIYFDATVFIQYITLLGFSDDRYLNSLSSSLKYLKEIIRGIKHVELRITKEHLEETVRHITQAEKLSSFANEKLIASFGDSKNVFFNLYLKFREISNSKASFNEFLEKLIGYEDSQNTSESNFSNYMQCIVRYLRLSGMQVVEYEKANEVEIEGTLPNEIAKIYQLKLFSAKKPRKFRSITNDVVACFILGDSNRHLDDKKYGHNPIFITLDNTQHELRTIYKSKFPYDEWLIYSPQRALERFSMLGFELNSTILKDNVLAIIDEDFIRDSSLIDTLATFVGDDNIDSHGIISLLTKLTANVQNEASDLHGDESEKSSINYALITLHTAFYNNLDALRRLFSDDKREEQLVSIIQKYISSNNQDEMIIQIKNLLQN